MFSQLIGENMRIAFASMDNSQIDEHFGSARYWQIYDLNGESTFVGTRKLQVTEQGHNQGKFDQILTVLGDCDAIFVNRIGESAAEYMIRNKKRIFEATGEITAIITKLLQSDLLKE